MIIYQALLSAWKEACNSTTPATVVIPKGTFMLKEITLAGPCKAPIELHVDGTVKAPTDPSQITKESEWVNIRYIDQFTLSGSGTFDGQGSQSWTQNDCRKASVCSKLPNVSLN